MKEAYKMTTVRNWRKLVKSFKEMSNREIIKYLKDNNFKQMHNVSAASSRVVFALNDHYVIKVARSHMGVYQNLTEINVYEGVQRCEPKYLKYLVPVMLKETDTDHHIFVIMKMAKKPKTKLERKQLNSRALCGSDEQFHEAIKYIDNFMDTDNANDLINNNLGFYKGTARVLDYGCGKEVSKEFKKYRQNGINSAPKLKLRHIYHEV